MTKQCDYLVVGSGLTGAVIARLLQDAGLSVLVIDRRDHLGGNVHDETHESGVRIHTYGPHYFRTSSEEIWAFVNRFSSFFDYQPELKTLVDGKLEDWPITAEYMQRTIGESWTPAFVGTPSNFEEASLAMMPKPIYEKFIHGYSKKQWGIEPSALEANLAGRFDVRINGDRRLKNSKYQGIPSLGYTHFMSTMLAGIEVIKNCDFKQDASLFSPRYQTIYTGPIDELFNYTYGRLEYRGQRRSHVWHREVNFLQPCGQVNNPAIGNGDHVRSLEWKHMMPPHSISGIQGTVITTETPFSPDDQNACEYPFPSEKNQKLYQRYRALAESIPSVLVCGRLGEYKYYDMDQAIGRAFVLGKKLIEQRQTSSIVAAAEKAMSTAEIIQNAINTHSKPEIVLPTNVREPLRQ